MNAAPSQSLINLLLESGVPSTEEAAQLTTNLNGGSWVSQVLDSLGIAVRAGHHCAKPAHAHFGIAASTRASFYLYTTPQEIDALVDGLEHVKKFFGVE